MNHAARLIITGASRGIGAATARLAAAAGCAVAITARTEDALLALAAELEGRVLLAVAGEVSDPDFGVEFVARARAALGGIDALINNAGILGPMGMLADCDPRGVARNLLVNLAGPAHLAGAALPALRASFGRIVNLSSGAALRPVAGWAAYCAAKAGLDQLGRVIAAEEPRVTTVNYSPGMTATGMQEVIRTTGRGRLPPEVHARFVDAHAQGRLNSVEDAARALLAIALIAPHEWSGEHVTFGEPRVTELVALAGLRIP